MRYSKTTFVTIGLTHAHFLFSPNISRLSCLSGVQLILAPWEGSPRFSSLVLFSGAWSDHLIVFCSETRWSGGVDFTFALLSWWKLLCVLWSCPSMSLAGGSTARSTITNGFGLLLNGFIVWGRRCSKSCFFCPRRVGYLCWSELLA